MGDPMPDSVRKIWDDRKIRGFVLFSLSLQILLLLCAPLRKRTSNSWIRSIIWLAYSLANLVANFAIGLIASSQCGGFKPAQSTDVHLLAFWAPFLLIHLGGPDTIISFSLKDNALWLRHLLGPLFQVVATLTVFAQSLGPKNKLSFPTLVLFLIGIIRCAERTLALYLGSLDGLRSSVKEDEYRCHNNIGVVQSPHCHNNVARDLPRYPYIGNYIGVVQCAHDFFERFSKGLIADLLFTSKACRQQASTSVFIGKSPEESFHIIAAELNFIYETLFTKLYVAHTKLGYFFRAMSFSATSIALVCFYILDKHGLHRIDVVITYTLIFGSMALDSIALFMLIFSDWTVASCENVLLQSKNCWQSCWETILLKYLHLKRPKLYSSKRTSSFLEWSRQILFGRCSESIYTFNLIDYALKESRKTTPKTITLFRGCLQYFRRPPSSEGGDGVRLNSTPVIAPKWGGFFGLKDLLDKFKYRSSTPLSKDLWEFIFNDIREKKKNIKEDIHIQCCKLWEGRGDWILQCNHRYGKSNCTRLSQYIVDYDYEESLILWHIATELCYNTDKSNAGVDNRRREYSKTLSDYMLYLLFMQPTMMFSVTRIGQHALSDTCAIAKIFFRDISEPRPVLKHEACKRILEASPAITENYTIFYDGARKPQLLFLACDLAKALTKLGDKKWDLMSQVWVELLSYAASHCRPNSFAQSLSKGGELVAFVWLVMEHLQVRPK